MIQLALPTCLRPSKDRGNHTQRRTCTCTHIDGVPPRQPHRAPAIVHNARLDNLAANQLGYALYSDMFSRAPGPGPANSARYIFLDPGARLGARRQAMSSLFSAPPPATTHKTATSQTSSASSQPKATSPASTLGRPQRPLPRHRHQGRPSLGRRRNQPDVQPHGTRRRSRTGEHDLDRRARIQVRRSAQPPRKLGREAATAGATRTTRRPVSSR